MGETIRLRFSAYTDKDEYAISTWTLDTLPLEEALKTIAGHGFHSVELWADTVHFDPRTGVEVSQVQSWLRALSLCVHSVHAPFRNFENPPASEMDFRRLRMDLWRKTLENAARVEAPIVVMHGLDRFEYNYTNDQAHIVRDCLGELCAYAGRLGIVIALENISPSPGTKNADEIRCTLENQRALFADVDLRFCLDIGHVPLNTSCATAEVDAAGDRLVTLHIHNNDGVDDAHNLPNDGILDWPVLRAYIRGKGYRGQFVMEVLGGQDPRDTMARIAGLFEA